MVGKAYLRVKAEAKEEEEREEDMIPEIESRERKYADARVEETEKMEFRLRERYEVVMAKAKARDKVNYLD